MRRTIPAAACLLLLAACNRGPAGEVASEATDQPAAPAPSPSATADPLASNDASAQPDDMPRPLMQAQVLLDRMGFSPGVIDGKPGLSTRNALMAFQEKSGLPQSGELDPATAEALKPQAGIPATRVVTIPADFAAGPFAVLPKDPAEQAKLPALGYASLEEKLAERFHTTPAVLRELNPALKAAAEAAAAYAARPPSNPPLADVPPPSPYRAGLQLRVPNVGADALDASAVEDKDWLATLHMLGVGSTQSQAAKIVVSKGKGTLRAYDSEDNLIGAFTVTTGSSHDPLPLGTWKVNGKSYNPEFSYDPSLFWDVPDSKGEHMLPPGPNGPVGVVWIDLSKEHYGIHGTPEPEKIGRSESHGCVRLTNWDAARLAQMVSGKTEVVFEA